MAGMKFRKSCDLCNVTFFTPNRNALYCAKCAKKMGVAEPTAPPASAGKPVRAAVAEAGRGRVATEAVAAKPRGPVLVKKAKKGPRPPKPTELTTELRDRISQAYKEANGGGGTSQASMRDLHASIAEKLWVRRWMVAEVVQDLSAKQARLVPEQKNQAAEIYKSMVETHERPVGGRRRAIAAQLNVPVKEVILAVRDWSRKQEAESPTPRLSRQQLFEIEKAYWNEIETARWELDDMPSKLADALGFANRWQVLRWIDVLHDDPHAFENVPEPPDDTRQAIIEAYNQYLAADAPPEKGLHQTISDQLGGAVKPRQVHKVLQNYRHERRNNYTTTA
jgi:hypothetical protein